MDILAQKDLRRRQITIVAYDKEKGSGITLSAQPVQFVPVGDEMLEEQPMLGLDYEDAIRLMDELWNCGIRPTDVGGLGELAATKRHLADLQKLVFKGRQE